MQIGGRSTTIGIPIQNRLLSTIRLSMAIVWSFRDFSTHTRCTTASSGKSPATCGALRHTWTDKTSQGYGRMLQASNLRGSAVVPTIRSHTALSIKHGEHFVKWLSRNPFSPMRWNNYETSHSAKTRFVRNLDDIKGNCQCELLLTSSWYALHNAVRTLSRKDFHGRKIWSFWHSRDHASIWVKSSILHANDTFTLPSQRPVLSHGTNHRDLKLLSQGS